MKIIPTNLNAIIQIEEVEKKTSVKSDGFIIPVDTTTVKTPSATLIAVSEDCTDEAIKSAVGKKILYRLNAEAGIPDSQLAIIAISDIVAILSE
jgi:co-chaperonin GroES (HSP10)